MKQMGFPQKTGCRAIKDISPEVLVDQFAPLKRHIGYPKQSIVNRFSRDRQPVLPIFLQFFIALPLNARREKTPYGTRTFLRKTQKHVCDTVLCPFNMAFTDN